MIESKRYIILSFLTLIEWKTMILDEKTAHNNDTFVQNDVNMLILGWSAFRQYNNHAFSASYVRVMIE